MDSTIPAELLALKDQFETWRQTRQARSPIPGQLWERAISLLDRYPASTITRLCRLHPATLKKRAAATTPPPNSPPQPPTTFFQLHPTDLPKNVPAPLPAGAFRLQIERPDGTRLTLSLPALDSSIINTLCTSFLRS